MHRKTGDLPFFRYHPDPCKTGAFGKGPAVCDCCHRETDIFYAGPFYSPLPTVDLCPDCIASGRAAGELGGCFTPPDCMDDLPDAEKRDEIACRTPSYFCLQQPCWLSHCGDYCAYLGAVEDMLPEDSDTVFCASALSDAVWEDIAQTWNDRPQQYTLDWVKRNLGFSVEGYLFRCLHCGRHLLYLQRD